MGLFQAERLPSTGLVPGSCREMEIAQHRPGSRGSFQQVKCEQRQSPRALLCGAVPRGRCAEPQVCRCFTWMSSQSFLETQCLSGSYFLLPQLWEMSRMHRNAHAKRSFPLWAVSTKVLESLPKCCRAMQEDVQLPGTVTCSGCWAGIAELGSPVPSLQTDFPWVIKDLHVLLQNACLFPSH